MIRTTVQKMVSMLGFMLALSSCLQERPPINRVQPDYIDKLDLIPNQYAALTEQGQTPETLSPQLLAKEPIYWTQTTLIAKPTTTGFVGLTSYSDADKILWQVTESSLLARQAYSFVKNAPGGATGIGDVLQSGDVVAIFNITEHFDIQNDYNPTTGEQLNVIVENTTDRPWYQRRYMHVDWSQNLITGYNTIFAEQDWSGTLSSEPVPVFVNSPNDPNAPVFVYADGGSVDAGAGLLYFDIVNQAVLHPETTTLTYSDNPGSTTSFSAIPLCDLGETEGSVDCAPAQVSFRVAFRRFDPSRDYEPASLSETLAGLDGGVQNVPHLDMERFGFFDRSRIGFDTTTHVTLDTERLHVAARHNLWLHHHALSFGTATSQGCNSDSDCGDSLVCEIGNSPTDTTHRGMCAPLTLAHLPNGADLSCQSDDDCKQWSDTGGVSHTAVCDPSTSTCAEHYFRCASDLDCASVDPQSTCDLVSAYFRADNMGLCLMPFRQRQVRPIPYFESENYPSYMEPVTEQVVTEWNSAFTEAVTSARRHECEIDQGIDPSTADPSTNPCNNTSIMGTDPNLGADAQFIFVGCHSPVWGTAAGPGQVSPDALATDQAKGWDLPACGPQGTSARLGDLRYNMIGAITDQDAQGYWGLANLASDPETGEMIAGRGAVWQTITDYYSTLLVTYVKLLTGAIDPASIAGGSDLVSAMSTLGSGRATSASVLDRALKNRAQENIVAMAANITRLQQPGAGWFNPNLNSLISNDPTKPGAMTIALQRLQAGGTLGDGTDNGTARLMSLAGTPLETRMINSDQAMLAPTANPDPTAQLPATIQSASPFQGQSSAMRREIEGINSYVDSYQCGMEANFQDDILLGLAQRLATGAPISASDPLDADVSFGQDWNFKNSDGSLNWALMTTYAAQFIHHGVLAHELGHSLGQRHNFTASADAINYNDQYWLVRPQGHPAYAGDSIPGFRPRYAYVADSKDGNYYSPQEIAGRVDEWSYSSVMDYKGLNEDAHGIGRYDYAFIKNGYVNLVEAFKKVANPGQAQIYAANVAGNGLSSALDLSQYPTIKGMHYTQIPTIFGTTTSPSGELVPNIGSSNRYDVFLRETVNAGAPGLGSPFTNTTADGHLLVPYRFDSDERAGLVWQDQRYDNGADIYESEHYVASHIIDYYFINSFARLRTGFSTGKYVSRIWSRYLDQLRQTTQIADFDLLNYQDFWATLPGFSNYLTDPTLFGGYVNMQAMSEAADAMASILTMPAIGSHLLQQQLDGNNFATPDLVGYVHDPYTIAINDGRYFESAWNNAEGYWWYDSLDYAGSYYDKTMMIEALTDPELLLLERDTPSDIRLFQLSFYTMFPNQMIRLFGGLLSEDYADYASQIAPNGTIDRPHVATLSSEGSDPTGVNPAGSVPLDPQTGFTIELWSAVQTISQFPATYDQRYMDYGRLWVDGSVEAIEVDPSLTVSFVDPNTGLTYRASHFDCNAGSQAADVGCSSAPHASIIPAAGSTPASLAWNPWKPGQVGEAGIGARMILHIQDMETLRQFALMTNDQGSANSYALQEGQYLDLMNVMRSMTKQFGQGDSSLP